MVLVSGLLLLLVVTIMALSMFRSFGMQEKIAGNMREKQRAVQASVSTQEYAEWWLTTQSNATRAVAAQDGPAAAVPCTTTPLDANAGTPSICNVASPLSTVLGVSPATWPNLAASNPGAAGGVYYTPPGFNYTGNSTNASVADIYYGRPRFYIQDAVSITSGYSGEMFLIDAFSYGESSNSVAVVESTVAIQCYSCGKMGP